MNEEYKKFNLIGDVNDRLSYLLEQKENYEKIIEKLPEGNLLVAPGKTDNFYRYYNRKSPKDRMGEYLGKEDEKLKMQLAQRKYAEKIIKNITKEINKLKKIQGMNLNDSIMDTYANMNSGIKRLINPITVDDETYIKNWQSIPYEGLGFSLNDTTEYYSNKSERMRSKSEVSIANQLYRFDIPYKYECPVYRKNGEVLYPDFTILDVRRRRVIYWEHLGRMGDMSYVSKNLWKLEEYKKIGIIIGVNLYISFESESMPMGTNEPLQIIREIIRG